MSRMDRKEAIERIQEVMTIIRTQHMCKDMDGECTTEDRETYIQRFEACKMAIEALQEPKPTLTRKERNFIESFRHPENKVLVRDNSGLYINYDNKPEIRYFSLQKDMFKFIEITETWSVGDLLKLEVEE